MLNTDQSSDSSALLGQSAQLWSLPGFSLGVNSLSSVLNLYLYDTLAGRSLLLLIHSASSVMVSLFFKSDSLSRNQIDLFKKKLSSHCPKWTTRTHLP